LAKFIGKQSSVQTGSNSLASGWAIAAVCLTFGTAIAVPILYYTGMFSLLTEMATAEEPEEQSSTNTGTGSSQGSGRSGESNKKDEPDSRKSKTLPSSTYGSSRSSGTWEAYEIISVKENSARFVAGRKASQTYTILIRTTGEKRPTRRQLEKISHDLRSGSHNTTFVYFYLTGMDQNKGAWATSNQSIDEPVDLNIYHASAD